MRKRCVKATYCGAFWPLAQLLPCHGRLPTRVVCSRCIVNPYVPAFLGPRRFVKPSLKRQTNSLAKRGCASVNAPETTGGAHLHFHLLTSRLGSLITWSWSPHPPTPMSHHVVLWSCMIVRRCRYAVKGLTIAPDSACPGLVPCRVSSRLPCLRIIGSGPLLSAALQVNSSTLILVQSLDTTFCLCPCFSSSRH